MKFSSLTLLQYGVHFGHLIKYRSPYMDRFLIGWRQSVVIIDLQQTTFMLKRAFTFLINVLMRRGHVVLTGLSINETLLYAEAYLKVKWLPGLLTNFIRMTRDYQIGNVQAIDKRFSVFDKNKNETPVNLFMRDRNFFQENQMRQLHKKIRKVVKILKMNSNILLSKSIKRFSIKYRLRQVFKNYYRNHYSNNDKIFLLYSDILYYRHKKIKWILRNKFLVLKYKQKYAYYKRFINFRGKGKNRIQVFNKNFRKLEKKKRKGQENGKFRYRNILGLRFRKRFFGRRWRMHIFALLNKKWKIRLKRKYKVSLYKKNKFSIKYNDKGISTERMYRMFLQLKKFKNRVRNRVKNRNRIRNKERLEKLLRRADLKVKISVFRKSRLLKERKLSFLYERKMKIEKFNLFFWQVNDLLYKVWYFRRFKYICGMLKKGFNFVKIQSRKDFTYKKKVFLLRTKKWKMFKNFRRESNMEKRALFVKWLRRQYVKRLWRKSKIKDKQNIYVYKMARNRFLFKIKKILNKKNLLLMRYKIAKTKKMPKLKLNLRLQVKLLSKIKSNLRIKKNLKIVTIFKFKGKVKFTKLKKLRISLNLISLRNLHLVLRNGLKQYKPRRIYNYLNGKKPYHYKALIEFHPLFNKIKKYEKLRLKLYGHNNLRVGLSMYKNVKKQFLFHNALRYGIKFYYRKFYRLYYFTRMSSLRKKFSQNKLRYVKPIKFGEKKLHYAIRFAKLYSRFGNLIRLRLKKLNFIKNFIFKSVKKRRSFQQYQHKVIHKKGKYAYGVRSKNFINDSIKKKIKRAKRKERVKKVNKLERISFLKKGTFYSLLNNNNRYSQYRVKIDKVVEINRRYKNSTLSKVNYKTARFKKVYRNHNKEYFRKLILPFSKKFESYNNYKKFVYFQQQRLRSYKKLAKIKDVFQYFLLFKYLKRKFFYMKMARILRVKASFIGNKYLRGNLIKKLYNYLFGKKLSLYKRELIKNNISFRILSDKFKYKTKNIKLVKLDKKKNWNLFNKKLNKRLLFYKKNSAHTYNMLKFFLHCKKLKIIQFSLQSLNMRLRLAKLFFKRNLKSRILILGIERSLRKVAKIFNRSKRCLRFRSYKFNKIQKHGRLKLYHRLSSYLNYRYKGMLKKKKRVRTKLKLYLPVVLVLLKEDRNKYFALNEANQLNLPSIAIVDSDMIPQMAMYPIPGNNDMVSTIEFYTILFRKVILDSYKKLLFERQNINLYKIANTHYRT
jgi:ribosomal protein S2